MRTRCRSRAPPAGCARAGRRRPAPTASRSIRAARRRARRACRAALARRGAGARLRGTRRHRRRSTFLERRLQEPDDRRDGHRADRGAEQDRPQSLRPRAHEEDRDGAQPGRERSSARRERQEDDVHAGRLLRDFGVHRRPLLRDEDGHVRVLHDGPGDASQQRAGKSSVPARPDDDQIRVTIVRQADDLVGGIALHDLAVGRRFLPRLPSRSPRRSSGGHAAGRSSAGDRRSGCPRIDEAACERRRRSASHRDRGRVRSPRRRPPYCLRNRRLQRCKCVHAMLLRSHALIVAPARRRQHPGLRLKRFADKPQPDSGEPPDPAAAQRAA